MQNGDSPNRTRRTSSPVRLFVITIGSILVADILVQLTVRALLPRLPVPVEALLVSFLLLFVLFPGLYLLVLSPLLTEIAEHAVTERMLFESQQEWEDTFNIISSMITIHDRDFNIVRANRAAMQRLGLPMPLSGGAKCHLYFHGLDAPPEHCTACAAMTSREEVTREVYEPQLGAHLEIKSFPRIDGQNRLVGSIQVVRDITARKKYELALSESNLALRKSEMLYRAIVDGFDGFIYRCSDTYVIEYMNERLIQRCGHDATGEKCYDALHGLAAPCTWCPNGRVLAGETVRWEVLSPKDKRWYYCVNTPIRNDDGTISKQGVIIDITSRKEAEARLAEANEKYRRLVDFSPHGIAVHDGENFVFLNDAGAAMLGAGSPDVLIGLPVIDCVHPDEQEAAREMIRQVLVEDRVFPCIELKIRRVDGRYADMEMAAIPFVFNGKKSVHLIATDVTVRKETEGLLKTSLAEKEVLVRELHHRVKNNLQVVFSLVGLQGQYLRDPQDRELVEQVLGRIRTMALIQEELYQSDKLSKVDFATCVRKIAAQVVGAKPPAVRFGVTTAETWLDIETAIPGGLMINELVLNAFKHAFPLPIDDKAEVDVELEASHRLVVVKVRDNGVGLPETIEFEKSPSLGFRLARILARQIGATIDVSRHRGTEFTISFKRSEE